MKILVTGAAGFIGSHVAKRLLESGATVVGLDNLNSYYSPALKRARLADIKKSQYSENFKFVKCDISDAKQLDKIFKREKFVKVCHLAAQAGVRYSFENPESYIQSNIVGFFNILQMCVQYKIKHLVYASSSSVYGNNSKVPFSETDRVDNPESLYAATKKSNELLAYYYSSQYKLSTTGLRFFTVYGPWGRPDMAPYKFLEKIIKGEPIEVYNRGNLSRDFSYIDDIVTGVVKIVLGKNHSPNLIYNIGNSSPVNLLEFIKTIEYVSNKKAKKIMKPMQKGDVYTTYADCSQLKRDYGFAPDTKLEKGIEEFYKWYIKYHKIKL